MKRRRRRLLALHHSLRVSKAEIASLVAALPLRVAGHN
jgi:hypothetical protein